MSNTFVFCSIAVLTMYANDSNIFFSIFGANEKFRVIYTYRIRNIFHFKVFQQA